MAKAAGRAADPQTELSELRPSRLMRGQLDFSRTFERVLDRFPFTIIGTAFALSLFDWARFAVAVPIIFLVELMRWRTAPIYWMSVAELRDLKSSDVSGAPWRPSRWRLGVATILVAYAVAVSFTLYAAQVFDSPSALEPLESMSRRLHFAFNGESLWYGVERQQRGADGLPRSPRHRNGPRSGRTSSGASRGSVPPL